MPSGRINILFYFYRKFSALTGLILTGLVALSPPLCAAAHPFQYSRVLKIGAPADSQRVYTGLDRIRKTGFSPIPEGNIAVVVNDGSMTQDRHHILDILAEEYAGKVTVILNCANLPGQTPRAGFVLSSDTPKKIICLNPQNRKMETSILESCDLMLIDIQDLGIRSSFPFEILIKALKLAAEYQLPCYLLDRPNPLNAQTIQGPLDQHYQLPQRYGLTIGELALFLNEEQQLEKWTPVQLYIVPLANYRRSLYFDDTGLNWNLGDTRFLTVEQLLLFCGFSFAGASNLNIGLGTFYPYRMLLAPWLNPEVEFQYLNQIEIKGMAFQILDNITPQDILGASAEKPLYAGQICSGLQCIITDRAKCNPVFSCAYIIGSIAQRYPHHFNWRDITAIDDYLGGADFRIDIKEGADLRQFYGLWEAQRTPYQNRRLNYLLYAP